MPDAIHTNALSEALLDFAAAPGRHALRLGEPTELFDALETLALWALGRLPAQAPEPERLRAAALLFITRACFAAGNTHYQLLGLLPHAVTPERLRARYRALIGLTHPDRAIGGLPPDAAGMINRAHAVLANAQQRAEYDSQLNQPSRHRMAAQPGMPPRHPAAQAQPARRRPAGGRGDAAGGPAPAASEAARGKPLLASLGRGLVRRKPQAPGFDARMGRHMTTSAPGWMHRWSPTKVRVWLASAVVLACALGVLLWGLQGSGTERRLVVAGPPHHTTQPHAQPDETVQLRLPAAWSRALDLPLSQVQMQDPEPGAAVPGAVGSSLAGSDATKSAALTPQARGAIAASPGALARTPPPHAKAAAASAAAPSPKTVAASSAASSSPPATIGFTAPSSAPSSAPSAAASAAASNRLSASVSVGIAALLAPAQPPTAAERSDKAGERPSVPDNALAHSAIIWDVDQERARAYLKELLNQMQKPEQARSTNQYLQGMKVHGSLLRPAAQALRVQSADLLETHQPGVLRVQGVLKVQSDAPEHPARVLRFEVQAEFRGTHQGTVLTLLNMKELP